MSEMLHQPGVSIPLAEGEESCTPIRQLNSISESYGYTHSPELEYIRTSLVTCSDHELDTQTEEYIFAYQQSCFTWDKIRNGEIDDLNAGLDIALCSVYFERDQLGDARRLLANVIDSVRHSPLPNRADELQQWLEYIDTLLESRHTAHPASHPAA